MTEPVTFRATLELGGRTATGIEVPPEVVAALGGGNRPAVVVRINDHSYTSTIGTMGGRRLIPVSAENRAAAGVSAGDEVEVTLALESTPRTVEVPDDLAAAMTDTATRAFFDGLAPSHRKEWVRWVQEAKRPETRATRVAKTVEALAAGRKTR